MAQLVPAGDAGAWVLGSERSRAVIAPDFDAPLPPEVLKGLRGVRTLLDTQCGLWMLAESERLQRSVRAPISERRNELVLSVASRWEIAIKSELGKPTLPGRPRTYLPPLFERTGASVLPIQAEHALAVANLPLHHRDPFDHLLVAVAKVERLPILTADRTFEDYDLEILRT